MSARTALLTAAIAVSVLFAHRNDSPVATPGTAPVRAHGAADGARAGSTAPGDPSLMHRPQPMRAVGEALRAQQARSRPTTSFRSGAARPQARSAGS